MGRIDPDGGQEPGLTPDGRLVVRIFAGSAAMGHLAPPDDSAVPADVAREIGRRALVAKSIDEFRACLPPVWREWFDGIPEEARVAVWRGCAALHLYAAGAR